MILALAEILQRCMPQVILAAQVRGHLAGEIVWHRIRGAAILVEATGISDYCFLATTKKF
ncbi:hypothetical protein [Mesorhizobium sp. L103C131B0]|uniref:hypothetical protein n=1 Tax=unclassified Mesorhizobium TaxID=325217 RepID=UPI0012DC7259|nr:hypothetical protein [Mesorhizobium sp. L103C131B0]